MKEVEGKWQANKTVKSGRKLTMQNELCLVIVAKACKLVAGQHDTDGHLLIFSLKGQVKGSCIMCVRYVNH